MNENAARVAWAGVGVRLPRRLVTARGLGLAVRQVLSHPGYRDGAGRLRRWAERHDGAAEAASVVERFAGLS
jgi:UDP:flavonoid glycosyltransferase YjiC (YdhE family)